MSELRMSRVTVCAGDTRLLDDISLSLRGGELLAIIGENGSGKSTMMRTMAGYTRPHGGTVTLDARCIHGMPAMHRSTAIGWMPQNLPVAWPVSVHDAVATGRYAHGGLPGRLGERDRHAVHDVLQRCGLADLAGASIERLSGGELARVHLARTLVGGARFLLMDEPVAALDPRHGLAVMRLLRALATDGHGVAVVLHDLGLAARFADRLVGLKAGKLLVDGSPETVVTPANIRALFGVDAWVTAEAGWPVPVMLG